MTITLWFILGDLLIQTRAFQPHRRMSAGWKQAGTSSAASLCCLVKKCGGDVHLPWTDTTVGSVIRNPFAALKMLSSAQPVGPLSATLSSKSSKRRDTWKLKITRVISSILTCSHTYSHAPDLGLDLSRLNQSRDNRAQSKLPPVPSWRCAGSSQTSRSFEGR